MLPDRILITFLIPPAPLQYNVIKQKHVTVAVYTLANRARQAGGGGGAAVKDATHPPLPTACRNRGTAMPACLAQQYLRYLTKA